MKKTLLALVPVLLAGCAILELVMLPVKLVFSLLESIGEGAASLVGGVASVEPIDGPAPTVLREPGGDWLIEPAAEPSRFRVTLSAPGRASQTYTWPDDFQGIATDRTGTAHVICCLEATETR